MTKVLGVTLIVLAIAIAVIPQFTDCQSQGKAIALPDGRSIPMKCHWTAQAEIATGIPLALVGGMVLVTRRKENLRVLGIMGGVLGVSALLIPNSLIGVCSSAMVCNTVMKPTLTALGSVTIVAGAVGLVMARKWGA